MTTEPPAQGIGRSGITESDKITSPSPPMEGTRTDSGAVAQSRAVMLGSGEALTPQATSRIMGASRARVLVIAGPVKSGKTTLIASVFNRFERGPFAGYMFAGSETLMGFEERSWLARAASGRLSADTQRTRPGAEHCLLHLRVRNEDLTEPPKDLLFADLSGEDYEHAKDSVDECRKLVLIRRADSLILLVDGAKLVRNDARQSERRQATMLLQSCLDADHIHRGSFVDVLISKWDLIEGDSAKAQHLNYVARLKELLQQRFAHRLARLRFFEIVARRERGDYEIAHGLSVAFRSWVDDLPPGMPVDSCLLAPQACPTEFDRYLSRRFCSVAEGA
jgi:hypothetical protein